MLRGEGEREGERREGERRSEKPPPPPPPPPPPLPLPTSSELIAVSVCFLFSFPLFCVAAALCLKKKEAFVSGVAEFSFRRTRSLGGRGGRPAPPKEEFFFFSSLFSPRLRRRSHRIEGCPQLREVWLYRAEAEPWTPESLEHLEAFQVRLLAVNPNAKVFLFARSVF